MRIDRVEVETLDIPLTEPLTSGSRHWDRRRIALIALHSEVGVGRGEFVAGEPGGLGQTVPVTALAALRGIHLADPVALEAALRDIDRQPFVGRVAHAAVESAIVDLMAQARSLPVARVLADWHAPDVAVNGLIGIVETSAAVARAKALAEAGYGCLKLKFGAEEGSVLVERLAAVRDAVGPSVRLRLDFNGSLDTRTAADVLGGLRGFDLEYVEQPISTSAGVAALARLRRECGVPIAADEALRDLRSARALLDAGAVDVLVVKPARVGGLRQARSIVELASAAGVRVMVSTLLETGIGIAGALHLAATVDGSHAHGLGTAALLASDLLLRPLRISGGRMAVPAGPGLGVELDPDAVERYRAA